MINEAIPCNQLVDLVTDYLESVVPAHVTHIIEHHLATCHGCAVYIEQMRQTIKMVAALETGTLREW